MGGPCQTLFFPSLVPPACAPCFVQSAIFIIQTWKHKIDGMVLGNFSYDAAPLYMSAAQKELARTHPGELSLDFDRRDF
jgi:hypothetical protein